MIRSLPFYPYLRSFNMRIVKLKKETFKKLLRKRYVIINIKDSTITYRKEILHAERIINIPEPKLLYDLTQKTSNQNYYELHEPGIWLYRLQNCSFYGGLKYILFKQEAIYTQGTDIQKDYLLTERLGYAQVNTQKEILTLDAVHLNPLNLDIAIHMLSECSENYAHFFTEILAKLALFQNLNQFKGVPIILDSCLPEKFITLINQIMKNRNPLVFLRRGQYVNIKQCIYITNTANIRCEERGYILHKVIPAPTPNDFDFSSIALNHTKKLLQQYTEKYQHSKIPPQKICLIRCPHSSYNGRSMRNHPEAVEMLKRHEFYLIDPSQLTILEQAKLFSNARIIITEIGAGIINSVFAPPGCQILAFSPIYKNANYYYYSNFAGTLGHKISFIVGEQIEDNDLHILHRDYTIDLKKFNDFIINLLYHSHLDN